MKTVYELNQDELDELRESYLCELRELNDTSDFSFGEEIPMEVVIKHYDGTHFVEEDFWCNIKE